MLSQYEKYPLCQNMQLANNGKLFYHHGLCCGIQGLVDLWVMGIYFAWFILNPCSDLWGFMSPATFP